MYETSQIVLSERYYAQNLAFIKRQLKPGVRFCSVVKGNAYGHGLIGFAEMAIRAGVDYFAVHAVEEAFAIRTQLQENTPEIFIMGAITDNALVWAIENDVEFAVFDTHRLRATLGAAKQIGKKAKVHIELETGMHRTGFEFAALTEVAKFLLENKAQLNFQGLFTHFAGAESKANEFRVTMQKQQFETALAFFQQLNLSPKYHHMACSAAAINYPETQGNLVRIGILQYGFWPNRETEIRFEQQHGLSKNLLRRIIRWSSAVMAIKQIEIGSFIGYGTNYFADQKMTIAIIPVGYAHGYSRNLSNVGRVLINGKVAFVVGTVNMNSLTVDISNIENVAVGTEVVLIGNQKQKSISVSSFSEQSQQLNYELLTRLPVNIPRIVKK